MSAGASTPQKVRRFPPWLVKPRPSMRQQAKVRRILTAANLPTVCAAAQCPNLSECYARGTATFLILGESCTRSCRFCAIPTGDPGAPRADEPQALADAAERMGLRYVVITSVTRDDLPDGGAEHFARTILTVRRRLPQAIIEVLTPDFQGQLDAVETVAAARPDVFNHNVETVPRLYSRARPQADYRRSLDVLAYVARRAERTGAEIHTKSGLMVGLGEKPREIRRVLGDLRGAGCEILTIGQYLSPSPQHLPVARFVEPCEFDAWKREALAMGFVAAAAGPFVRSSYRADGLYSRCRSK